MVRLILLLTVAVTTGSAAQVAGQDSIPRLRGRTPRARSLLNSCLQRNPFRPTRSAAPSIPDAGCLAPHSGATFDGLAFSIVARGMYPSKLRQSIVEVRGVGSDDP